MNVDFIGIGAQKSGTSWVYACLYEHPEICAPVKEIHFFSRPRYQKGINWYENHWSFCSSHKKRGEFSTSYLYSDIAPARIAEHYPKARLIAILREPVARAYSQYRNAIKAGEIIEETSFDTYIEMEKSCFGQGRYEKQLKRYAALFQKEQLLLLTYEDIEKNPLQFIQKIYAHIGVDESFIPPSVDSQINVARTPKMVGIDSTMHTFAETLRRNGLGRIVHLIKRSGITDIIRSYNSKEDKPEEFNPFQYKNYFAPTVDYLEQLGMNEIKKDWKYETYN